MASNPEIEGSIQPAAQRRLKGFLALLPDTGIWFPYNQSEGRCDPLHPRQESSTSATSVTPTTKITSRKQQRRFLKRCQLDAATSSTDVELGDVSLLTSGSHKETISLVDHFHDRDVAVLFLFDPYQPYSINLLQKLIMVSRLAFSVASQESQGSPFDRDFNAEGDSPKSICNVDAEVISSSQLHHFEGTSREEGKYGNEQESLSSQRSAQLHCLVVTPCTDVVIVNRLLENTGTILIPWTQNNSAWRMATGSHVCPNIVGVYECRLGQNLFHAHQEELALDWCPASQIRNAWLHDRISALTLIQRIQGYTLHPSASMCIVQ